MVELLYHIPVCHFIGRTPSQNISNSTIKWINCKKSYYLHYEFTYEFTYDFTYEFKHKINFEFNNKI